MLAKQPLLGVGGFLFGISSFRAMVAATHKVI
jgi:hypothetical protein